MQDMAFGFFAVELLFISLCVFSLYVLSHYVLIQ